MTWLTKWLIAAVLATTFGTAVHGLNACFTDEKCLVPASGNTDLSNCGIADTDLDDLATCLDTAGRSNILGLVLEGNLLTTVPSGLFDGMTTLFGISLSNNAITTIDEQAFQPVASILVILYLDENQLTTVSSGTFAGMGSLTVLHMHLNQLAELPSGIFDDLGALKTLYPIRVGTGALTSLFFNQLTTLPAGIFDYFVAMETFLQRQPADEPSGISLANLGDLSCLILAANQLTTLPAGIFENLPYASVELEANPDLQCLPSFSGDGSSTTEIIPIGCCECTDVATCEDGLFCNPGKYGYTCDATVKSECADDSECDTAAGEKCCEECDTCESAADIAAGACGDPHMTGFRGQTFDFTGQDGGWYAVVSDLPYMHVNMRVTSPVPSVPEITYITGISIVATDTEGLDHTIVISVKNPHSMESSCAAGVPSCLADGALHVVVDGNEVMVNPGEVTIAPGVAIGAVNLPGACRSFGFEKYWERKVELLSQAGRRLSLEEGMQDMSDWVLADPTATNMVECAEYVAHATAVDGVSLFSHHSEHTSFQIVTPTATIRLSHGRLHQLPMRDPTDQFDLPDHLAWQMNLAVDHSLMSVDATGILGETLIPTLDEHGAPIMQGMGAIRGVQEDYRVSGPLDTFFSQGQHQE